MRLRILCYILVIIIIGLVFYRNSIFTRVINPSDVYIYNVSVDNQNIQLNGIFLDSSCSYKDFKYDIKGSELHIQIIVKYYLLVGKPNGDVNILIDGNGFQSITHIYLIDQAKKKCDLIWKKG